MAKEKVRRTRGKLAKESSSLPFSSENYIIFGVGIILILLGYFALARGPWDSFFSLSLAPILLVLGYCVLIPVAILYRKKRRDNPQAKE